jgi:hypothetical protein
MGALVALPADTDDSYRRYKHGSAGGLPADIRYAGSKQERIAFTNDPSG